MYVETCHGDLVQRFEVSVDVVSGFIVERLVQHFGELVQGVRVVAETELAENKYYN